MRVIHARFLVEEAAASAARHRIETGHGEGAVRGGPEGIGGGLAAEEARGIHRGKGAGRSLSGGRGKASGYFFEISQCPTAACGSPDRSKVSTASAALHTTGSPGRLKEVLSTAPMPVRLS